MKTLAEKFNEKFIPEPMSGCWLWVSAYFTNGYGYVTDGGRNRRASRVAYELFCGPIPKGLLVRHSCDNKSCVNPAHLLVGTDQDNSNDAVRRGRVAKGERAGRAKLTDAQVAEIRLRRATGESSVTIARDFGVWHTHVLTLAKRRSRT